jgi:hypothetical protein
LIQSTALGNEDGRGDEASGWLEVRGTGKI